MEGPGLYITVTVLVLNHHHRHHKLIYPAYLQYTRRGRGRNFKRKHADPHTHTHTQMHELNTNLQRGSIGSVPFFSLFITTSEEVSHREGGGWLFSRYLPNELGRGPNAMSYGYKESLGTCCTRKGFNIPSSTL